MNKLKIEKETKIYVACPANFASGGPELLHQLVYELTNLGFSAYMYYYGRINNTSPVHEAYLSYKNLFVDKIIDNDKNILIVPETNTKLLYDYSSVQKVIWWLSVDNYLAFLNSKSVLKRIIKKCLYKTKLYPRNIYRFNNNEPVIHFVQSEYAKQWIKSKGIENAFFLSDYINKLFIEKQTKNVNNKKDIVIYNPKKGLEFTKMIIAEAKEIKFVPIENMKRDEVAYLFSTAKVYIDFGNHPGKDRMPREAAISGCCVITSKNGSAKFYEDVPIPNEFKFDAKVRNIPSIVEKIRNCFNNYETEIVKFENYREMIKNEQAKFIDDIKNIFRLSNEIHSQ